MILKMLASLPFENSWFWEKFLSYKAPFLSPVHQNICDGKTTSPNGSIHLHVFLLRR